MKRSILLLLSITAILSNTSAKSRIDIFREIPLTSEKSLQVKISGSFETIYINKGPSDKVITIARKTHSHSSSGVSIDYSINKGVGYLEIDLDRNGDKSERFNHTTPIAKANFPDAEEGDWYITFPDAMPIDFDLEFDVGKAEVNLTGLQITRLRLEAGASKVHLKSLTKNPQTIEKISIEAGVGKFTSEQLGNLNFKNFSFEGGIGAYKIDLSGALRHDAKIRTEVGMGTLTITLPTNVPAKLVCDDHWLNSCNFPRFFNRGDGVYETKNFDKYSSYVTINAECGVGSISVKWSD